MNEDKIIKKLLEHDEKFNEMVTKVEFKEFREEMFTSQDRMMVILQRLD